MKNIFIRLIFSLVPVKSWRKSFFSWLYSKLFISNYYEIMKFFNHIVTKKLAIEQSKSVTTIFLGSSHMDYTCNPEYISPSSFNLGSRSQDLVSSFFLYSYYRNRLSDLKHIILAISIFSPGFCLSKSSESYMGDIFCAVYKSDYPDHTYNKKLSFLHKQKNIKNINNYNGFCYPSKISKSEVNLSKRVGAHLRENNRTPDTLEFLNKLILLKKEDKRHITLVYMPVHSQYREMASMMSGKSGDELLQKITTLATSLSVPVINLYSCFADSDFYDFDHLNPYGAQKFSLLMKECLEKENENY